MSTCYHNESIELSRLYPSTPIDKFNDLYIQVFDLIWMQDATENCLYPELIGEPLRQELSSLEDGIELIPLGERMFSVAVDKSGVVGRNLWKR